MDYHEQFTNLDWLLVAAYLGLTTLVGHLLKETVYHKRFFSGWQIPTLACGFRFDYRNGNQWCYFYWGTRNGLRCIRRFHISSVGYRIDYCKDSGWPFLRKSFYQREIYSPYDYMGNQLGEGAKRLATLIFQIGGILGQSVRVLVAALALKVVTPLEFNQCIWIIGTFAVCWTLMGGMRTVIWTDVMQFFLFVGAGLLSLFWMISELDGGWSQMMEIGNSAGKFTLFNLTTDPAVGFTLWVAIIAVPFQNLSAFGVDQLNAQRMFVVKMPPMLERQ